MDEVRGDLGVGLRAKGIALGQHLVLDGLEIFDDAIVNDRHAPARKMRMRIGLGDASMRCPARVGYADVALQRFGGNFLLELGNLAHRTSERELITRIDDSDTGRVIAAVLEPLEPIDENIDHVSIGNRANNSAHKATCPFLRVSANP